MTALTIAARVAAAVMLFALWVAPAAAQVSTRIPEMQVQAPQMQMRLKEHFTAQALLPPPPVDAVQRLRDPAAEAEANAALGDLRPYHIAQLHDRDRPRGIVCRDGVTRHHRWVHRGAIYLGRRASQKATAPATREEVEAVLAYNRALAATLAFRTATGCEAEPICDARYDWMAADRVWAKFDPDCPGSEVVIRSLASFGDARDLLAALDRFPGDAAKRDVVTIIAFRSALVAPTLANAEAMIAAGFDINRPASANTTESEGVNQLANLVCPWFIGGLSLYDEDSQRLPRAEWLFEHGLKLEPKYADYLLGCAAGRGYDDVVRLLLRHGAAANGRLDADTLNRLASAPFGRAPLEALPTPFFEALSAAVRPRRFKDHAMRRGARRAAIAIYRGGGRFVSPGRIQISGVDTDPAGVTILLAAAHREGRAREVAGLMLKALDQDKTAGRPARAELRRVLTAFLACRHVRPIAMDDRVMLCPRG